MYEIRFLSFHCKFDCFIMTQTTEKILALQLALLLFSSVKREWEERGGRLMSAFVSGCFNYVLRRRLVAAKRPLGPDNSRQLLLQLQQQQHHCNNINNGSSSTRKGRLLGGVLWVSPSGESGASSKTFTTFTPRPAADFGR